jgi:hypothetical protein
MYNTKKNYIRRTAPLFLFLSILLMPGYLLAQSSLTLAITPPLMKVNMEPGDNWSSYVKIVNDNPQPLTAYVQVLDFKSGKNGGVEFIKNQDKDAETKIFLSQWIDIDPGPFQVPAFQSKEITFVIRVPEEAEPGGHYAAILVGTKPPEAGQGTGTAISVASQISSLILLNIQGDVKEQGWIREFSTGKDVYQKPDVDFKVVFENTGNVHVQPIGDIRIYNMWGKERGVVPVNQNTQFGNILPESKRTWEFQWKGEDNFLEMGRYRAELLLGFGQQANQTASATVYFWVVPVVPVAGIIGGFILFLVVMILGIRAYIRKAVTLARRSAGLSETGPRLSISHNIRLTPNMLKGPIKEAIVDLRNEDKKQPADRVVRFGFLMKKYYKAALFLAAAFIWAGGTFLYLRGVFTAESDFQVAEKNNSQETSLVSQENLRAEVSSNQAGITGEEDIPSVSPIGEENATTVDENRAVNKEQFSLRLLNGCGTPGLASTTKAFLTEEGFDVASLGNADSFNYQKTVIKYKKGNDKEAKAVAGILKVAAQPTEDQSISEDVVVIIGKDYSPGL